jgi:hypothetical protein
VPLLRMRLERISYLILRSEAKPSVSKDEIKIMSSHGFAR